jgi:hypothetical protein
MCQISTRTILKSQLVYLFKQTTQLSAQIANKDCFSSSHSLHLTSIINYQFVLTMVIIHERKINVENEIIIIIIIIWLNEWMNERRQSTLNELVSHGLTKIIPSCDAQNAPIDFDLKSDNSCDGCGRKKMIINHRCICAFFW